MTFSYVVMCSSGFKLYVEVMNYVVLMIYVLVMNDVVVMISVVLVSK